MDFRSDRHIGDIIKEKNIILKGADAATAKGFTQLPNFILKSKTLSAGDKITFAMLLSYAWQNDYCFPGQVRLAEDLGLHETNVRKHLKSLETNGLLAITRRGQGKTNIYELKPQTEDIIVGLDRAITLALDRVLSAALDRLKSLGPLLMRCIE